MLGFKSEAAAGIKLAVILKLFHMMRKQQAGHLCRNDSALAQAATHCITELTA
ncbi:hypothetical protein CES85_5120 [Ochrobactrum quorumnocens]|uniref:Uncharacterized protein n=1 Tax=Ochrobactrum quorumnocens TaxID=271865 RepID=A0A248UCD3_9HYPH|nr:hypothetical protein CES85_5120 [[Ochrobactrum] quorumnocens]